MKRDKEEMIKKLKKTLKHEILIISIWWILKTGSGLPLNRRSSNESLKLENKN